MKNLNKQATVILLKIIVALEDETQVSLPKKGSDQITVERLGELIMPEGKGQWYSITQTTEGKPHAQMNFIVIDKRDYSKELDLVTIYSQQYAHYNDDTLETSITIEHGKFKGCIAAWQSGHCKTAVQWFQVLKKGGILKF